jgi:hypothetical protein
VGPAFRPDVRAEARTHMIEEWIVYPCDEVFRIINDSEDIPKMLIQLCAEIADGQLKRWFC